MFLLAGNGCDGMSGSACLTLLVAAGEGGKGAFWGRRPLWKPWKRGHVMAFFSSSGGRLEGGKDVVRRGNVGWGCRAWGLGGTLCLHWKRWEMACF